MSDPQFKPSRRQFIKGAGVAGAASLLSAKAVARAAVPDLGAQTRSGKAKNLIFLVVDGMCMGTLSLAHFWKLRHEDALLHWLQLYDRPDLVRALQDTASASSPVTDSAAAGSAWGSGRRVMNGAINMRGDGAVQTSLYEFAKAAGKATGLVSTCRITHATPASFGANVARRSEEATIARQYLDREYDVLLGGGARYFEGSGAADLLPAFIDKRYRIARDSTELARYAGDPRLLGLFASSHLPYAIDRSKDPALKGVPGLAGMFEAALKSLSRKREGFVLQLEGGRVDHAGHVNDPAGILHEMLEFDRCIPIAMEFQRRNPDTLVVLTTDHGTGGCNLNGWGKSYNDSGPALDRINRFKASFEALGDRFTESGRFDAAFFENATGLKVSPEKADAIQQAIDGKVRYLSSTMTQLLAEELIAATAVGWTSNNHTAELVELLAIGPGTSDIPAFLRNEEVFHLLRNALAI